MVNKIISPVPVIEFDGNMIENCYHVAYDRSGMRAISVVKLSNVFEWIKEHAKEEGLTVKMVDDNIIFINGKS